MLRLVRMRDEIGETYLVAAPEVSDAAHIVCHAIGVDLDELGALELEEISEEQANDMTISDDAGAILPLWEVFAECQEPQLLGGTLF